MPPENQTRALIRNCYAQLSELEHLVATNKKIDQRQAFIDMHYLLLSDCERILSIENDARDSDSNIEYDDDNELDIENLTKLLRAINQMISEVKNEHTEYEKLIIEANKVLPRLLPECKMALKELEFMASFYLEDTDPWCTFRKGLQHDLNEYETWPLEDQIENFKTIALGCKRTLATARTHFLNDEDKLNHPATQERILNQFNDLWQQMQQYNSRESKIALYKLHKPYKQSKQLESLFRQHTASEINIQSYRKSIVELQEKGGCIPFNFGFSAYLKARSTHAETLQETNNTQILKACKSVLAACLKMKQYTLTQTPHETVAIVPVPQFSF